MNIWFYTVACLLSIVDMVLCFGILNMVCRRTYPADKKQQFAQIRLIVILALLAALGKCQDDLFSYPMLALCVLLTAIGYAVLYRESVWRALLIALTWQIMVYTLDLIMLVAKGFLWDNPHFGIEIFRDYQGNQQTFWYYAALSRIVMLFLYLLLRKSNWCKKASFLVYQKKIILFDILGVLGIVYFERIFSQEITHLLVFSGFAYLCAVLGGFMIFMIYITIKSAKENTLIVQMRNELLEKNHESMKMMYEQNAKTFHDFKNHLALLYALMNDKQFDEAFQYVITIREPLIGYERRICTHNDTIDMVLNYKIAEARGKDIQVEAALENCSGIKMESNDICSMISNLMDNAIEACEKVKIESKWIQIKIKYENEFWIMHISNSIAEKPSMRGEKFLTGKKNGIHGWGMQNVTDVIEKYQGYLQHSYDDKQFEIKLFLCI